MSAVVSAEAGEARPVEVELKYRPTSAKAGKRYLRLAKVGGLAAGRMRSSRIEDRYVDTADGALARAGFAARLRLAAKSTTVSLKSTAPGPTSQAAGNGRAHARQELEGPAHPSKEPREWPPSAARSLVLELAGEAPLVEVATLRQVRRKRILRNGSAELELSLDDVAVVAGGRTIDRFAELEVELVHGSDDELAPVARALDSDPALAPSPGSKLEAARAAIARASVASAPLKSPGVLATDTIPDAGRKVIRFHFARLVAREDGARAGDDEEVHGMRVATRRIRAAWKVFDGASATRPPKGHRAALKDLAAHLGAVRDLDVLIAATKAWRAGLSATDREGLRPLLAAWRAERRRRREALAERLDSGAHATFLAEFGDFVAPERTIDDDAVDGPGTPSVRLRDGGASRAWKAYERVRAYEPAFPWADVPTLHALRIASKKLRYTLEFLREPIGADVEKALKPVVALQGHLGSLHDADVAVARTRAFLLERAGALDPDDTDVIGRYLVARERDVAQLKRGVAGPWQRVAGRAFRRRLGRALANL